MVDAKEDMREVRRRGGLVGFAGDEKPVESAAADPQGLAENFILSFVTSLGHAIVHSPRARSAHDHA